MLARIVPSAAVWERRLQSDRACDHSLALARIPNLAQEVGKGKAGLRRGKKTTDGANSGIRRLYGSDPDCLAGELKRDHGPVSHYGGGAPDDAECRVPGSSHWP
jgi:hypothetical protein